MSSRSDLPNRRRLGALLIVISVTAATLALVSQDGASRSNSAVSQSKKPDPTMTFKVPPLPNGSAQVKPKAGMSDKDWEQAYKETGRPKFNRNTVKKTGENVERD